MSQPRERNKVTENDATSFRFATLEYARDWQQVGTPGTSINAHMTPGQKHWLANRKWNRSWQGSFKPLSCSRSSPFCSHHQNDSSMQYLLGYWRAGLLSCSFLITTRTLFRCQRGGGIDCVCAHTCMPEQGKQVVGLRVDACHYKLDRKTLCRTRSIGCSPWQQHKQMRRNEQSALPCAMMHHKPMLEKRIGNPFISHPSVLLFKSCPVLSFCFVYNMTTRFSSNALLNELLGLEVASQVKELKNTRAHKRANRNDTKEFDTIIGRL